MKKIKTLLITVFAFVLAIACMTSAAACSGPATAKEKVGIKNIALTTESYAFVIKKGNTEMQTAANELLEEISANGTLQNIIASFFDGTATFAYTNPASPDGCLVVATSANFPPFEYKKGSQLTGIDMQIASLLAAKLNKTLYILDEAFQSVFTSVNTGEAAIGMAGITVTESRLQTYDFSNEYYASTQVIVVKDSDDTFDACTTAEEVEAILATKTKAYTIGTQSGTTGYFYASGEDPDWFPGFTNLSVNGYDTGALAIKDLQNGKINAVVLDLQPALMICKSLNK